MVPSLEAVAQVECIGAEAVVFSLVVHHIWELDVLQVGLFVLEVVIHPLEQGV